MLSIEELEKGLKEKQLNSIYLLYGEERFVLETNVKKIKNLFGEQIKGINYILLDETNIENITSDIESPAFGYEKKLIIIKNSGLFKKSKKKTEDDTENLKSDKSLQSNLSKYIKTNISIINESVILVFIEEEVEKNSLYKTIDELGIVCNFEKLKPIQITKRLKSICNAYKVNVDDATLNYIIETCGTSMQELINEIRKLIEYAGENGTIKKQDVDNLCIKQVDAVIFDLTDYLGKKDLKEAIRILGELIYSKEPIQKILVYLYNHFKKLYIVKLAKRHNKNLAESMNLKPNQMFLTTKYQKQADFFETEELRVILEKLIDLDKNYKIGLIDINIGLEAILCNYCS